LAAVGMPGSKATPLAGGLVNYVWRVVDAGGHSYILKHAEAALKFDESMESDPARLAQEARSMQALAVRSVCERERGVGVPGVVAFDVDLHALLMTDAGDYDLAAAYKEGALDMHAVGSRLATWLAALHLATQGAATDGEWANAHADKWWAIAADALPECMARHGYASSTGKRAKEEFLLSRPGEVSCCVHGDLRPENVLVSDGGEQLVLIDWEESRRQSPALDVGIFAGHACLLDTFYGGRGLQKVFLSAYREAAGSLFGERLALRAAVEFAMFAMFWQPQLHLCNDANGAQLAATGAEILSAVVEGDLVALRSSCLGPLFD
jgi:aminoglycoside phosphotransferase (APT) family kinase protein